MAKKSNGKNTEKNPPAGVSPKQSSSALRILGDIWRSPMFKLPFALTMITAVSALALGFINSTTAPIIEENAKAQMGDALMVVMNTAVPPFEEAGEGVYIAKDASGNVIGYCVQEFSSGFDPSPIEMLVGMNADGTVRKVHIIAMSETPGLGTRARDEQFLKQFEGRSGTGEVPVDAISGATVTSKAVAKGVQRALIRADEITN